MNDDILRRLRCPTCAGSPAGGPVDRGRAERSRTERGLARVGRSLRCADGHSFDIARQGYVNLAGGQVAHHGDSAQMVADRETFLATGHYDFISAALAAAAAEATAASTDTEATGAEAAVPAGDFVLDAGAGTGRHLAAVLDACPACAGLALDISKPAVRRAARAHPRAAAALCDTWQGLPVASGTAGVVLNVFAPRNGAEFQRVLRPGGTLLVVAPAAEHLAELIGPLGLLTVDAGKRDQVAATLSDWFRPAGERRLERSLRLGHPQVRALVGMGPSAWHTDPSTLAARIAALPDPATVTAAVHLHRFIPRPC